MFVGAAFSGRDRSQTHPNTCSWRGHAAPTFVNRFSLPPHEAHLSFGVLGTLLQAPILQAIFKSRDPESLDSLMLAEDVAINTT